MTTSLPRRPLTRDDIEAKLRELQGGVGSAADEAAGYALAVGVALLAGVVVVAFLLGRRRGRKKNTIIEVRRI